MAQMSFEKIREIVMAAIKAKEGDVMKYGYCIEIYPDAVVYESCGQDSVEKYYRRSYSIVDGEVTLGEAVEVEKQVEYVPLQAAGQIMAAKVEDTTGHKWDVRVAAFGIDLNGNYWDKDVMTAAVAKFEGAKVFMLTEAQHQDKGHKFGKPTGEMVGVLQGAVAKADGIYATLILLPTATWLRDNLVGCMELGLKNVLGLSVDVRGKLGTKVVDGKKVAMMASINSATVDVVYDPVARGEFLKMVAARQAGHEEDDMLQKLLAALQGKRPDLYKQINDGMAAGTITEDQAIGMVAAATVTDAGGDAGNAQLVAAVVDGIKGALTAVGSNELQEVKLVACGMILTSELTNSKLPEAAQDNIRAAFAGKVFETEALQASIKSTKEMLDRLSGSGSVTGAGGQRIEHGRDSLDKFQAACDGLLGIKAADNMRDVPVFTSLRAAYVEMTGDTDVVGVLDQAQLRRMQAAYGDTSFSYVLGNALYRRMVADYREASDLGVSRLVGNNIRNAADFRTLQNVRIGYYGDIPTVDTDNDDYPDLGEVSDEKIEYALQERGGIITINRRMIINDDLRAIQKIISRLPRAARRTLAKKVWSPFITNALYKGDNKAIFHTDHGNLGSTAYGITPADVARAAMFAQAEPGSAEVIGLRPVTVAFPAALRGIVTNVNTFQPQAVTVDNGNSMFGYFQPGGLVESPLLTDANDWYFFADPNEVEIVELAFLNGQQEPTMLVADNPANGQMFVGGRIQYRINHDFNCEVMDFRGAYKAVVAP